MGRRARFVAMSEFYCTKCGRKGIDIPRKCSHLRKSGHLKKLYCPWCKEEHNHVEVKNPDDLETFQAKYEQGCYLNQLDFLIRRC